MAFISFYDTTERDKQHLSAALQPTDHRWEYIDAPLSLDNIRPETEVLSIFVTSNVTRQMIDMMPRLRLIACRSTGYNNIDFDAVTERGITVVNVPSYGEFTVAEYTFTLLLALTRKLPAALRATHDQDVTLEALMGIDIHGLTLGIVGLGRIGAHVARMGKGFGMNVIAYDPLPRQELADELGLHYAALDELAATADIVSLHMPLLDSTHHIIGDAFFDKMKPTAYLVNTARGELVDTSALIAHLRNGSLAGAALDVVEGEKLLDADNEVNLLTHASEQVLMDNLHLDILRNMPQVILTPHTAFNTDGAIRRINDTTAQSIIDFWYDKVPYRVAAAPKQPGKLIVMRHAESEWNAAGRWTGTTDVHLSELGFRQAARYGQAIKDIKFDYAYCSQQLRTLETLESVLDSSQQFEVPHERSSALNERDYGDYTGMNKWEVKEQLGDEVFERIRRDWDYPVPHGETLKQVYERALPFYLEKIVPRVTSGQTVVVLSHGNAIRALMKYIESIDEADMTHVEMSFGNIMIYDIDANGRMVHKQERTIKMEEIHA